MRSKTATSQTAITQQSVPGKTKGSRAGPSAQRGQFPGILVEEHTSRFARGRERGKLHVLVEMSGEAGGHEAIAGHLAQVISDVYFGERHSVTSGLQEAIREVNVLLHDQNRDALPEERLTAGVSCALLRGEDLYVAQAGPAAIYLSHEAQVIRFPELSPWLDNIPMEAVDTTPLGDRRDVHVDLFHSQVADGDTVLMVNSGVARRASPRVWRGILGAPSLEAVQEGLSTASQGKHLSALILRVGEQPDFRAVVQKAVRPGHGKQKPKLPVAHPLPQIEPPPVVAAPVTHSVQESVVAHPPKIDPVTGERVRALGRTLASLGAGILVLLRRMVPGPLGVGERATLESSATASTIGPERGSAKTQKGRQQVPQQAESPRVHVRGSVLQKLLLAIALLIPLLVGGLVAFTLLERDQVREAEVEDLWSRTESLWVQAGAADDPATVRVLLNDALANLDKLLMRQPGRADALELRQEIQQRLEANNHVQRIPWEGRLVTYPSANLSRVVVEGAHVFVLDRAGNKVYHHQLDELQQAILPETKDTVLVKKGDQVGNILVGDLLDMAWLPAGNGRPKATLLIMESQGSLLQYDPGTKELVALRTSDGNKWQLPQLMGGHSGRFYLLDSKANQIWRYSPTPDGYSAPPEQWLESAIDLAGVRDMAIGDSIFLLYADGKIRKLSGGEPDTFDMSDWDMPPKGPTAIFTRPPTQTQWFYVADPGNNRIVQTSAEGGFKRQFRLADTNQTGSSDALAGVTSLFVDEIGGRAYFLSGNALHLIMLPE